MGGLGARGALRVAPRGNLVFKGGTSLSKAYDAIRRFSEDIDLTYDIRTIAADLIGNAVEPIPPSPSQERKWSREIEVRLPGWVRDEVGPLMAGACAGLPISPRVEANKVHLDYDPAVGGYGYVKPSVMLEFGARSTGEPAHEMPVRCDAAEDVALLSFPSATPRVMRAERTFWEKATAAHVFCRQGAFRGGHRFARHWHDMARLADKGFVTTALADRTLALDVARHKQVFFLEKDPDKKVIDYRAAVSGALTIVPTGSALALLEEHYLAMAADGMFLDDAEPFAALMDRCAAIQVEANRPG